MVSRKWPLLNAPGAERTWEPTDCRWNCGLACEREALSELVGLVERKEIRYHKDLPPAIVTRIKAAIQASRLVEDELKTLL